jgi:hypothetical protein
VRGTAAVIVGAGALLLTGCAAASEDDVRGVVAAFEDPGGTPEERCELLAPSTRAALESETSTACTDAITDVPLPGGSVTAVEVWGGAAQVRIGRDVVFLTETGSGWLVTAAACEPRRDLPYDCEVEGP